ncbi:diguanylate cyclase [Phyllobacterium sp. SYP-B3895]|uniref:sensor domain-containing diguanylate cyclase n=1 Tax=Phyllobacterium sp. SYP-B3895 TaxID=2663240 RepID=UPI0012997814|nr:sensor domain-containing diguanylate cyclase [Phyllobacterium sp. SYP-B3895]MRG57798.1 diguanylate cyclase [Phyllobacterium sp. SYP-B3895]
MSSELCVTGKTEFDFYKRESYRLAAIDRLDILDSPRDESIDRIVRLVQKIFTVDIGLVSVIDAHRQWYKSRVGLESSEIARSETFCKFTLESGELIIVPDTLQDSRFREHPNVIGPPNIRFYAGAPLRTRDGHIIGTVCAIGTQSRKFGETESSILTDLADVVMDRFELSRLAATDALTGALTRRAYKEACNQAISLALRHGHDLTCLVFDLDRFKSINDTYGHAAGDGVLIAAADTVLQNLRDSDIFGRLGGEEFAILLPYVDAKGALSVAERLRTAIAGMEHSLGPSKVQVTASFGVASCRGAINTIDALLASADAALYNAKNEGRNRCILWDGDADGARFARAAVLKAGAILYNHYGSVVDCTVKSLGQKGAGLVVTDTRTLPNEFTLVIGADGLKTSCRIISQDSRNVEVEFC